MPIELPPAPPGEVPARVVRIDAVMMPTKVIYALYIVMGAAMIMIAAQAAIITICMRKLGLL